jgi:hypothetical protein
MVFNKKAQVLQNLQIFIMGIVTMAVILAIGLVVLNEMKDNLVGDTPGDVTTYSSVAKTITNASFGNVTPAANQKVVVNNITPATAFKAEFNQTGGAWDKSGTTPRWYLHLKGVLNTTINASEMKLYNLSNVIGTGNYTVTNIATDIVHINFTNAAYMNTNISILYNRTFATDVSLTGNSVCYPSSTCLINLTENYTYGGLSQFKLFANITSTNNMSLSNLSGRSYNVSYQLETETAGAGATTASNATVDMITKLATVPVWIGLLIVIVMAMAILGYFYFRNE